MVSYVLREWLVMVPLILQHLAMGFVLSFPAVLTPALTGNGTDIKATKDETSWVAASYSTTGSIGFFVLPALMQIYGRRFINALLNIIILIGWLVIACAPNVSTLIAARAFQGLAFGGLYICSIIASEYSHPKRRGFFVTFKMAATGVGELICHGFGLSMTWRLMAGISAIPAALAALGTIIWPESPTWLAYKGRYEESVAAFEWLRGNDLESQKEIRELLTTQQQLSSLKKNQKGLVERSIQALKSQEFLKPFTMVVLLVILTQVCGRHYLLVYILQIMTQLTGDTSKAYYYTVGLDFLKIVAVLISSAVVKIFTRRTLLFTTGGAACLLLGSLCVVHVLVQRGYLSVTWLSPLILISFNILCYIGVVSVAMVLKGELFPVEFKGIGVTTVGVIYSLSSTALVKLTAVMLDVLETSGTFGVFLIMAVVCLVWLYFILPETKDRTLQNIELDFIQIKLSNSNVLTEQGLSLVKGS